MLATVAGLCVSLSAPDVQGERVESVLPEDDADVLLLPLFRCTAHWRVLVAAAAAGDALAPIAGTSMVIADASCTLHTVAHRLSFFFLCVAAVVPKDAVMLCNSEGNG